MSKNFVRVPIAIILERSVLVELQEGESLETLSDKELKERALNNLDDNYEEFCDTAEITYTEVHTDYAYYDDDDDDGLCECY